MKTTVIEESFRKDGTIRHRLTTVTEEHQRTLLEDARTSGGQVTRWTDDDFYRSHDGKVYPEYLHPARGRATDFFNQDEDTPHLAPVIPIRRDQ